MPKFPDDIYTEPSDLDGKTLANLGPLRLGLDVHAFLAAPQARHAAQGAEIRKGLSIEVGWLGVDVVGELGHGVGSELG